MHDGIHGVGIKQTDSEPRSERVTPKEDNWSGRSDSMRCKTCICYCPKLAAVGRCRALPPTMRGWPVVYETDWCFSHKLDETKI